MSRTHGTRQATRPASTKEPQAPSVAELRRHIRHKYPDLSVRLAGSKKTGLLVLVPNASEEEASKPRTTHVELDVDVKELSAVLANLRDLAGAERPPFDIAPQKWWDEGRDIWTNRALELLTELQRAARNAGAR